MSNLKFLLLASLFAVNSAHAESLQIQKENSDFYQQLDQVVESVAPRQNAKWKVSRLSMNTSRTNKGLIGLMPFKGTATSTLTWIPRHVSSRTLENDNSTKMFSLSSSSQELSAVATTWYREFFRTKRLPWSTNNEKDFITLVLKAREVAQDIASVDHPEWAIEQLVIERGITVKGTLAPLLSAEASFSIRFAFDLNTTRTQSRVVNPELTKLVLGLAEDISQSAKSFSLPSWKLGGFNLGLGIHPLLGVGVVNAKPQAFAHMIFKAKKSPKLMTTTLREQIRAQTNDSIRLFTFENMNSLSAMAAKEKTYIIDREKFRKGLAYALKLAKDMTNQADKGDSSAKKWRLGQIVYRYETDVNGQLFFTGLKGQIGAEVVMSKTLAAYPASPSFLAAQDSSMNNVDLQKALKTELKDNKTIMATTPASSGLSHIESAAFLKFNWGLDSPVADLQISAIPQVRLKFSP